MKVVIVGAGIAGLVAAGDLVAAGADVVLLDKGRSPGGRLATRRIGAATLDHGAQFFTVRTPAFQCRVDDWVERGLVAVWAHGFGTSDGHPRYVATAGMNSLAKDLAIGLDVRCSNMVFGIHAPNASGSLSPTTGWDVVVDDATVHHGDAVVVTTPLPQAFALLADSGLRFDGVEFGLDYDRTIALLATLDAPPDIAPPGAVQDPTADIGFLADNAAKGISAQPAITMHASAKWSEDHWDDELDAVCDELTKLAQPWLGDANIVDAQVKKWRFATPRAPVAAPCWVADGGTVVLAGDAFDGPRVEAAHNSGLAAAHALTS